MRNNVNGRRAEKYSSDVGFLNAVQPTCCNILPLGDTSHASSPLHKVTDHYHGRIDEVYCMSNKEMRAPSTVRM